MSDPHPSGGDRPGPGPAVLSDDPLILTPDHRIAPPERPGTDDGLSDAQAAALKDMVRAVLREELEGAYGARITRGVRRLVRAEVAALLAARDRD
jgi:hypothetical protein